MKLKSTLNKTSKLRTKRLSDCIKAQMDISIGRNVGLESDDYWSWCSLNKIPHIRVMHGKKYSYVSMDLPIAPGPSAYPKHIEMFQNLCEKYGVEPEGCFSVLKVPKADAIRFSKELFEIGVALYVEHNSRKRA